jgi:hypothetical protein
MTMHSNSTGFIRRAAALVAVGGIVGIGMAVPAVALSSGITAPSVILYSDDFPTQQVAVGYTTTTNATALRFGVGGWITSAPSCTVGAASRPVTVTGGSAVLASAVSSGTSVSCSFVVTPTAPGATTVTVEEFDAVGPAVSSSRPITAKAVTSAFDATDVDTVAGGWSAGLALAPGDQLTYDVDVIADANATDSTVVAPSGTTVTCGAPAGTALDASCTVTRPLTEGDLLAGVAPMSIDVRQTGGATFARFIRDVPVSAERRIELSMAAQPTTAPVGATVRVTLEAVNRGSVTLHGVTLGGFGAPEMVGCVAQDVAPTDTVTCAFDHVVMLDEVDEPIVPTIRATSFGPDSDESNDDATSATDIDAAAASVLSAIDPGITVARVAQPDPIAVPVAGPAPAAVRASIDLVATGLVSHPELVVTPTSGITLVGCSTPVCRIPLADTLPVIDLDFTALPASANAGLNASVPVRLVADGGIDLPVTTLRIQTFGVAASISGASIPVDTGVTASVNWDATVTLQPGVGGDVTLAVAPVGSSVSSCRRGPTPLVAVASAGTFSLGTQPPASTIACTVTSPITGDAATNGHVAASVTATLQAAGVTATANTSAGRLGARLRVTPGTSPTVPTHGYSLVGTDERPNQFIQTFQVQLRGDTNVDPLTVPAGVSCDGVALPHPDGDVSSVTCSVAHTITAAELAAGEAVVSLPVTGSGFEGTLELVGNGSVVVPVPRESVSVTVSEISAPAPGTNYTAGDNVRLLVSIHNDGGLPLTDLAIDVEPTSPNSSNSPSSLVRAAVTACQPPTTLAPASGYECLLEQQVTPYDLAAGQLGFTVTVSSSQGASASTQRQITIGRRAITLPETGSDVGALITLAAFATSVGVLLVGAAKRRQSRSLIVAGSGR